MNRDEYNILFHKLELNLVAFKRLMDCDEEVLKLVNAAIEAEREKVAAWMMKCGYATGHGDSIEDLLGELAWQIEEKIATLTAMCETLNKLQETAVEMIKPAMEAAVLKEREACAKVLDEMAAKDKLSNYYKVAALAIREKGAP